MKLNAVVGENIIEHNASFTGKIAVRCRTGKFYLNTNTLVYGGVTAVSVPNTTSDNPLTVTSIQADDSTATLYPYALSVVVETNVNQLKINERIDELQANINNLNPISTYTTYTKSSVIGSEEQIAVPGNPFGAIYFINRLFNGHIGDITLFAGAAGEMDVLLYRQSAADALTLEHTFNIDAVIGKNTISFDNDFYGYVGVRCRIGKFYYNGTGTQYQMTRLSLPAESDTPDTILKLNLLDTAGTISVTVSSTYQEAQMDVLKRIEDLEDNQYYDNIGDLMYAKLVGMGDSIMANSQGDTFLNRIASTIQASEYTNLAIGGATWAWRPNSSESLVIEPGGGTNIMRNQMLQLFDLYDRGIISKPDIIVMSAVINDVFRNYNSPTTHIIGDLEEEYGKTLANINKYSIYGEIRYIVSKVMQKFPGTRIFLLTPLHTSNTGRSYNWSKPYADAIINSSIRLAVPYIDCMGRTLISEVNESLFMQTDGLHPKDAGQELHFKRVITDLISSYYKV